MGLPIEAAAPRRMQWPKLRPQVRAGSARYQFDETVERWCRPPNCNGQSTAKSAAKNRRRGRSIVSVARWSVDLATIRSQLNGKNKRVGGGLRGCHRKACCVNKQHHSEQDYKNLSRHRQPVKHIGRLKHTAAACRKG